MVFANGWYYLTRANVLAAAADPVFVESAVRSLQEIRAGGFSSRSTRPSTVPQDRSPPLAGRFEQSFTVLCRLTLSL